MIKKIFFVAKKPFHFIDRILLRLPIIGRRLYLIQLSKFIIAGGLVTILDFFIYIVLTRTFLFWTDHYLWANFASMSIGAMGSFAFNKIWVFQNREKGLFSQYAKFWIVGGLGGMLFYQGLMAIFVEFADIYDILAKAMAAVITLFFRFGIQKFWIFK